MQAARNRIIGMMTGDESMSPPGHQHVGGECDSVSPGYYFVMPKKRLKQVRKSVSTVKLCAFGPFESPHVARFIGISAVALGLTDPDSELQPVLFRGHVESGNMERKTRRKPASTHPASTHYAGASANLLQGRQAAPC